MTIHDILMSCGSVTADTLIYIGNIHGGIKWVGKFKNITKQNEYLKFRVFFLDVDSYLYPQRMILKFIIQFGVDIMRYGVPIHPIPIGSIIKCNVREYGYFYGDGQEKRAITITKIGKVIDVIKHEGRVVYYSVAPSSNCTFNQYFVGDCLDSVWPENVEGVYYDN